MNEKQIQERLAYLRQQIEQENISYGEIAELQSLAEHIPSNDVLLLEWAGELERTDEEIEEDNRENIDTRPRN